MTKEQESAREIAVKEYLDQHTPITHAWKHSAFCAGYEAALKHQADSAETKPGLSKIFAEYMGYDGWQITYFDQNNVPTYPAEQQLNFVHQHEYDKLRKENEKLRAELAEKDAEIKKWQELFDVETNRAEHQRFCYDTSAHDAAIIFEQRRTLIARERTRLKGQINILKSVLSDTIGPIKVEEVLAQQKEKLQGGIE